MHAIACVVVDRVRLANLRQCAVDQDLLGPRFWARFSLANSRQVLAKFDDISFSPLVPEQAAPGHTRPRFWGLGPGHEVRARGEVASMTQKLWHGCKKKRACKESNGKL